MGRQADDPALMCMKKYELAFGLSICYTYTGVCLRFKEQSSDDLSVVQRSRSEKASNLGINLAYDIEIVDESDQKKAVTRLDYLNNVTHEIQIQMDMCECHLPN